MAAVEQPDDAWVWLARIRRPQGRRGEVFADLLTDFPEKFTERQQLWLVSEDAPAHALPMAPREMKLIAHWPHKGGIVLHFDGIDSISAAEALAGLIAVLPRAERVTIGADEAYIGDLIGCTLVDVAGPQPVAVGQIEDVDQTAGPVALLIVGGGVRGEILIPFVKSYLRKIDLAARRVEMALPEGLIDLNANLKPEKP